MTLARAGFRRSFATMNPILHRARSCAGLVGAAAVVALAGCVTRASTANTVTELPPGTEAVSLFGDPFRAPPLAADVKLRLEANLAAARVVAAEHPDSALALIWVGRRLGYLGRFQEAIEVFSAGVKEFPRDARFLRFRGHRYLSVRSFAPAGDDLEKARQLQLGVPDQVEPDGAPNPRGIPTSTLQGNIRYHLGLVQYLQGRFELAAVTYQEDLAAAPNVDARVATSYWLYMTLRRLGRTKDARRVLDPVTRDLAVIENGSYHRLLLLFKGVLPADSLLGPTPDPAHALDESTMGFGIGTWHLVNGRRADAFGWYRRSLAAGPWASFGYIAAENELQRHGEQAR